MGKTITLKLVGAIEDNEHIILSDFIDELNALKEALSAIDKQFFGHGEQTANYRVIDLRHSSPAAVVVEPVAIDSANDNSSGIIECLIDGVNAINTGTAPSNFDSTLLEKVGKLASPYKRRIREIYLITDETDKPVKISEIFEASITSIIGEDEVFDGSIDGSLEMINFHRGANKFKIYPTIGPTKVVCRFSEGILGDAIKSVGKHIRVTGKMKSKKRDRMPYGIEVGGIEILPSSNELPSAQDLRGIAPDFTGGLSSQEFVRRLRDE